MSLQNSTKIQYLLNNWPTGQVVISSWLNEMGLTRRYQQSGRIEACKTPKESLEVHVGVPTAFSVRGIRTSFSCIKDSRMITYVRRTLTVFGGMIGGTQNNNPFQ